MLKGTKIEMLQLLLTWRHKFAHVLPLCRRSVLLQATTMNTTTDKMPGSESMEDSTAWITANPLADFLLMHSSEIRYLCMFAYCVLHGCKIFGSFKEDAPMSYKFVRLVFQCTGGGILVPIFINAIPVSLGNDAYPIAIFASYLIHTYFPVFRKMVEDTPSLKAALIVLFETQRASVVVKLTTAAAAAIPASEFAFPLFGPIFCGSIAGCGGGFLPLDKGLTPLEKGLAPNMWSAFVAATCYHIFVSTSLSDGIPDAAKKAQVLVACFFILYGLAKDVGTDIFTIKVNETATKKEPVKAKKA